MFREPMNGFPASLGQDSPIEDLAQPRGHATSATASAPFGPGRLVRICRGPFSGIEGAVLEGRSNSRSVIALTLSQSGVYLEIDDALLEPAD